MSVSPLRYELWMAEFNPTIGREQAGLRPCLIISSNGFNQSRAELVIVVPITSKDKGIPSHIEINPPEGGLKITSFAKTEDVRSISLLRLIKRIGKISPETMKKIEDRLRLLLEL